MLILILKMLIIYIVLLLDILTHIECHCATSYKVNYVQILSDIYTKLVYSTYKHTHNKAESSCSPLQDTACTSTQLTVTFQ